MTTRIYCKCTTQLPSRAGTCQVVTYVRGTITYAQLTCPDCEGTGYSIDSVAEEWCSHLGSCGTGNALWFFEPARNWFKNVNSSPAEVALQWEKAGSQPVPADLVQRTERLIERLHPKPTLEPKTLIGSLSERPSAFVVKAGTIYRTQDGQAYVSFDNDWMPLAHVSFDNDWMPLADKTEPPPATTAPKQIEATDGRLSLPERFALARSLVRYLTRSRDSAEAVDAANTLDRAIVALLKTLGLPALPIPAPDLTSTACVLSLISAPVTQSSAWAQGVALIAYSAWSLAVRGEESRAFKAGPPPVAVTEKSVLLTEQEDEP